MNGDEDADSDDENSRSGRYQFDGSGRKLGPEQLEALKLLYRKLVRKLHPDLQGHDNELSAWHKKIWDRVQSAYKTSDRAELEKIYKLVLIRGRDLNDLSLGEIRESSRWLGDELKRMENEVKGLKRLPAWGFSRKKDLKSLERKVAKDLAREHDERFDRVSELAHQQQALERHRTHGARPLAYKTEETKS